MAVIAERVEIRANSLTKENLWSVDVKASVKQPKIKKMVDGSCSFYKKYLRTWNKTKQVRSVFYMKICLLMGFFRKKSKQGGWRHGIFQGFYTKSIWKVHWSIKKEVEFPWVLKKNSCGISMGPGWWPSNFQWLPHNFT